MTVATRLLDGSALLHAAGAFGAFSVVASGVCLQNHVTRQWQGPTVPRNGYRPFARDELPLYWGIVLRPEFIATLRADHASSA